MNAGAVGVFQRARGHDDVFALGASQRGNARAANGLGDGGDGREVAFGGHGKAGFKDVDAQVFESVGHRELFLGGHAAAGRLLAIAEGGVEDQNLIVVHRHLEILLAGLSLA